MYEWCVIMVDGTDGVFFSFGPTFMDLVRKIGNEAASKIARVVHVDYVD